jgi:hypothetical protein
MCTFSQVGINTSDPKGSLHVDGAKDNPAIGTPTNAQQQNDFVITSQGRVGVGTISPNNNMEVSSGVDHVSGVRLTRLPNARILATDANGDIVSGSTTNTGNLVTKQRLITASPDVVLSSPTGKFSFRYDRTTTSGFLQIRYNEPGTREIAVFIHENWISNGQITLAANGIATGTWANVPGASDVGSDNELNVFRIYDITDGTIYRVEINLINSNGLKESMIIEEF